MPEKDPVIELAMPSFLMPPLEIRHPERVPHDVMALIAAVTTRAWFPRRTIRLRALRNVFVSEAGLVIHPDLSLEPMSVREHGEAHIAPPSRMAAPPAPSHPSKTMSCSAKVSAPGIMATG